MTPVSQAAALQDDLRRASIEPYAWVLNKSVLAAGTRDMMGFAMHLPARLLCRVAALKQAGEDA